jgi:hypothetical protein
MKYRMNPITVDAVKIAGVGDKLSDGSIRVLLEGEGPTSHGTVIKRFEMMGTPKIGDYYVTNQDGTHNLVPRVSFEATHTAVEEETLAELEAEDGEQEEVDDTPSEAELRAEGEQEDSASEQE